MRDYQWHFTCKKLYYSALFVMLLSRLLVMTDNYAWFLDSTVIELIYIIATFALILYNRKGRFTVRKGMYLLVVFVLVLHTFLWGTVFVNPSLGTLTFLHFKSQIKFFLIIIITVFAVQQMGNAMSLLKTSYYAISLVLSSFFLSNLAQVDLTNLANIMSATERTRADFGFGHYNTLGITCLFNIILHNFIRKEGRIKLLKIFDFLMMAMSVCMLLCSACRSALTGLGLYGAVYFALNIDSYFSDKRVIHAMKIFSVFGMIFLALWGMFGVDISNLLSIAQRGHLFTLILPLFMDAGRPWFGLGFASNVAYASGLTPYTTRWMDNSYIYILVTTGVVGAALVMCGLVLLGRETYKRKNNRNGTEMCALLLVYAYISLFESIMFSSSGLVNYVVVPWLLLHISQRVSTEK